MFGEEIFSSFFGSPFLRPTFGASNDRSVLGNSRDAPAQRERCSQQPRDLFSEISRAVDRVFEETSRSLFRDAGMFHRHFYPDYLRDLSRIPQTQRTNTGVTLNGEVVTRPAVNYRAGRHANDEPVHMDRTRLQWYDSNTRRSLAPPPPPSNRAEPCGRLTAAELAKLPLSTFRIQPGVPLTSPDSSDQSPASVCSTPVRVRNRNESNVDCSPGSAYLQPVSRLPTLVEIQPLQSSPSRGLPECEVCLTEYRDKDRLRHLPCGHAFHSKCIDVWFNQSSTCPKCRAGVRTGLKRLERNRQRNSLNNRLAANAPVRAIRQRTAGTATTNNRRATGVNQSSTAQTPLQRASRNQTTARTGDARSSNAGSPPNASLDTSPRQTETSDTVTTNAQAENVAPTINQTHPESSSTRIVNSEREGVERSTTARRINQPSSNLTRLPTSVNPQVLGGRPPLSGTADKSAYARRKAAEAAIRRAELARQQQLEQQQSQAACTTSVN